LVALRERSDATMTELELFRGACLEALEILSSQSGSNPRIKELADQLRTVVEKEYQSKRVRGLRSIAAEINGWACEIGGRTARSVEMALAPVGIRPQNSQIHQIESIISRRRIRNDREYQALMDRVEEIYTNPSEQENVRILNGLLADYVRRRQTQG